MNSYILKFNEFINLNESKKDIVTLYHGGNISKNNLELKPQKAKRMEYGAGLYLTSHLDTAYKYSKGSRKLYKIEITQGNDIKDINASYDTINTFLENNFSKPTIKKINSEMDRNRDKYPSKFPLFILNNILINNELLKPRNSVAFSEFLLEQGVDYIHDSNTFGWGEDIYIIINFDKIISITEIKYSEEVSKHNNINEQNNVNLAPNGKPSNLPKTLYNYVRSDEFKIWFGDWENDLNNSSKIIDENGEPMLVYHGSKQRFETFDESKQKNGWLGKGFYLTNDKNATKEYGRVILKCFLNIRNPFIIKGDEPSDIYYEINKKYGQTLDDVSIILKEYNNDGVIFNHWDKGNMISCFYSSQIKIINK